MKENPDGNYPLRREKEVRSGEISRARMLGEPRGGRQGWSREALGTNTGVGSQVGRPMGPLRE